jgi:hypothetical protein
MRFTPWNRFPSMCSVNAEQKRKLAKIPVTDGKKTPNTCGNISAFGISVQNFL